MAHDGLRVLHVQRVKGIGGSERHLLFLLPALADAGVDVRMHVLVTDEGERFVDELRGHRGGRSRPRRAAATSTPRSLPGLVREIKAFDPDDRAHPPRARRRLRTAGGGGHPAHRHLLGARHPRLLPPQPVPHRGPGRRAPVRPPHRDLRARRSLRAGRGARPADRIRVVRYGMDASAFARTDDDRANVRIATGVAPAEIVVGVASRLIPGKGHDVLIDAFGDAARREPRPAPPRRRDR